MNRKNNKNAKALRKNEKKVIAAALSDDELTAVSGGDKRTGTGKVSVHDISVTKRTDASSADLFL